MNRRSVLKGLTAVLIGSTSLVFGSGAFTQVNADRSFDIMLADDDASSQLVVEPAGIDTDAVSITGDTFEIDTSGLSPESRTSFGRFGDLSDPTTFREGVFAVRNENDTETAVDITVGIGVGGESDTEIEVALRDPTAEEGSVVVADTTDQYGSEATVSDVAFEDSIEGGFIIDSGTGQDVSATLTIGAERTDGGGS